MPHSSTPGKPTEALTLQADARNVWGKLEAVAVRVHVLETDREKIQDCMNAINGEYTRLILYRYAWKIFSNLFPLRPRTGPDAPRPDGPKSDQRTGGGLLPYWRSIGFKRVL